MKKVCEEIRLHRKRHLNRVLFHLNRVLLAKVLFSAAGNSLIYLAAINDVQKGDNKKFF